MKRLAILNYMFIFDPTETGFASGSRFESKLADFLATEGIDASVIETAGSGVKAIYLTKMEILTSQANSQPAKAQPKQDIRQQVNTIANRPAPKSFKQTSARGIPYNLMRDKKIPDLKFKIPGGINSRKVGSNGS